MNIVIVGGGKVGYYLAKGFLNEGHHVQVIEPLKERCTMIANELDTPVVCGDGTTIEAMLQAGINRADVLLAVTGKDENNLIACQVAKQRFHVNKVVARANNPLNVEVMKQLGVDIAVSSTEVITTMIEQEVDFSEVRLLARINQGQAIISEIKVPDHSQADGRIISSLSLPQTCVIVAVMRLGNLIIPRGNTIIRGGDEVVALTTLSGRKELEKILTRD